MNEPAEISEQEFEQLLPNEFEAEPITVEAVCLVAAGLRAAANIIERLEKLNASCAEHSLLIPAYTREQFTNYGRALGKFTKEVTDTYFYLTRQFDGDIKIRVFIARSTVCKRKVVGHRDIPEQIIPARREEIVEWECTPVLNKTIEVEPKELSDE